jgi:HK97 family phage prohead protease
VTDVELEYRTAVAVEVRHPERIVDVIAVPYDEETEVLHRGRWVRETVAPGAFAGVTGDVTVNRAHDTERPLGRVVRFHPGDVRGLRTEVRISKTTEGDDVLALAEDGLLSASVGFAPLPGGEDWSLDRRSRRITKARLGHIALTGDPAYLGARVLAVRSSELGTPVGPRPSTPILDRILLERRLEAVGLTLDAPPANA